MHFTPGIKLQAGKDSMGRQYDPPAKAFCEKGTDLVIVGRGIYQAHDPKESAKNYQTIAWQAYQETLADSV